MTGRARSSGRQPSADGTADIACDAGAIVTHEPNQGKGNVVRRMFADIDADIYLLVDGDGTYDAASACRLVRIVVVHAVHPQPRRLRHRQALKQSEPL